MTTSLNIKIKSILIIVGLIIYAFKKKLKYVKLTINNYLKKISNIYAFFSFPNISKIIKCAWLF